MAHLYAKKDRGAARELIKRTDEFLGAMREIAAGQREFSQDLAAVLTKLTNTSDMDGQYRALTDLHARLKDQHMRRLEQAAPDDLTAFAEAINPNEPSPDHAYFLCEKLHEITMTKDARLMVSMPPGHAKPLDGATPIMMGDGSWKKLHDVEVGDFVITQEGRPCEVLETHDQGILPTLKITTATGRVVLAAKDHPFLTPSGWVEAGDLVKGSTLALMREFEISDTSGRSHDDFALAGYMMASAIVRGRAYSRMKVILPKFRTDDSAVMTDLLSIVKRKGFAAKVTKGMCYGGEVRTAQFNAPMAIWLQQAGLLKEKRHTVRVPAWVFRGDVSRIAAFLGAIVACDASLIPTTHAQSDSKVRVLQIRLRNAGMVEDLQRLFMRVGARSGTMQLIAEGYNYTPTEFWRLSIPDGEDQAYLSKRLRIRGNTRRFWSKPPPVTRFYSGRFAEDRVIRIEEGPASECYCLTVERDASFLADGLVVHNSTYCSHLYPAWYIGKFEGRKYLQAGHTQKFAEKQFCARVEAVINTEAYGRIFPGVVLTTQAASEFTTSNSCEYVTKGVGQGISGYRSHCNGVDDPFKSYKDAQSVTIRDNTWDWFANDFMTRLLPGGTAFMIATRWHTDDIAGRLEEKMEKGEITPWTVINLPAYSLGQDLDPLSRAFGECLWPSLFSKAFLENMRGTMSDIQWSCLYQGSPVLEKGNILQREWVHYYQQVPLILAPNDPGDPRISTLGHRNPALEPGNPAWDPKNPGQTAKTSGDPQNSALSPGFSKPIFALRTIVSCDSAETVTQRADNTAIQVWRLGSDYRHYLCDVVADRFEFPDLCDMIELLAKRWSADGILMETKGAGNQYIQARKGKAPCPIFPSNPGNIDKIFRFEGTMMLWRSGTVLLPERAPWLADTLAELLKFPSGKRDDNVDAASQYLKWSADSGAFRRGTRKLRGV